MSDFPNCSKLLFSILFADATSIFPEGTEYSKVIKKLNRELIKVSDWLKSSKFTLHVKKTSYMIKDKTK